MARVTFRSVCAAQGIPPTPKALEKVFREIEAGVKKRDEDLAAQEEELKELKVKCREKDAELEFLRTKVKREEERLAVARVEIEKRDKRLSEFCGKAIDLGILQGVLHFFHYPDSPDELRSALNKQMNDFLGLRSVVIEICKVFGVHELVKRANEPMPFDYLHEDSLRTIFDIVNELWAGMGRRGRILRAHGLSVDELDKQLRERKEAKKKADDQLQVCRELILTAMSSCHCSDKVPDGQ